MTSTSIYFKDKNSGEVWEGFLEIRSREEIIKNIVREYSGVKKEYPFVKELDLIEISFDEYLKNKRCGFRGGVWFGHIRLEDAKGNRLK